MKASFFTALFFGFILSSSAAQAQAPRIFFTDLTSGPNSGGETVSSSSGAYVTIYGNYFGSTQGASTVTLNGANCLRVVSWGSSYLWYQKIVVQLGANCASGNLVVTTSSGQSNGTPFTVRAGNIFCVSTSGNDSNSGKFPSSCWRTVTHAVGTLNAGDTVYVQNGINETAISSFSAVVNIQGNPGGTATNPIAIVGYPGATATVGDYNNSPFAFRVPQIGISPAYYVVAGLTLRAGNAFDTKSADHFWLVGNDISCSTGGISCVHFEQSTNINVMGNWVHDITGAVKLYHAVYFTTDTNHVVVGWNLVDPDPTHTGAAGCRGVQFYSTSGSDQFDLHVHDNVIRNTVCDGLNFNTVNPNNGTVEAYNNVIYHAGTGPDPQGQLSNYACLYMNSGTSTPTTKALVYNNSMYDCGSRGSTNSGALDVNIPTQITNNVMQVTGSSEAYVFGTGCSALSGSNNDWYGNGSAPCGSQLTGQMNSNPLFVSTTNLSLQSSSPLINAGASVGSLTTDVLGDQRAQGTAIDIGAYEFFTGAVANGPAAPTSLQAVVN